MKNNWKKRALDAEKRNAIYFLALKNISQETSIVVMRRRNGVGKIKIIKPSNSSNIAKWALGYQLE